MLQNHPFAVQACLEHTIVLSFAVPKEALQPLVPAPLQLDVYHQKWAFIAVALVHTKHLRPKGFPKFMGNSFTLVGYRIFVRYANQAGKSLRGLYILKSETNKRKMEILGNLFTQYKYATTDITVHKEADKITIKSHQSKFHITLQQRGNPVELPPSSPFTDWKTARRFAGPLPFTFSVHEKNKTVLIIEGQRQNWNPAPLAIVSYSFEFLDSLNLSPIILANAFEIRQVPYCWKKGKLETWQ